jgi:tRNA pseudouridine55 synthase
VGAHVTALRRTRSGPFALAQALALDDALAALAPSGGGLPLVAPADALAHLPRCTVSADLARAIEQGKRPPWSALQGAPQDRVCLLRPSGTLLAVAEPRPDGTVGTVRVFGVEAADEKH